MAKLEWSPAGLAGLFLFCDPSHLRFEHRELAAHKRVAVLLEVEPVVGIECGDLAAVQSLPRPAMAHMVRERTELPSRQTTNTWLSETDLRVWYCMDAPLSFGRCATSTP